jgi:hypothetical protein
MNDLPNSLSLSSRLKLAIEQSDMMSSMLDDTPRWIEHSPLFERESFFAKPFSERSAIWSNLMTAYVPRRIVQTIDDRIVIGVDPALVGGDVTVIRQTGSGFTATVERPQPKRISAAEIHAELYAQAAEALVEPALFSDQEPVPSDRVATLMRMGFTQQPDVKEFTELKESFDQKKRQYEFDQKNHQIALKYAMRYPNYKFASWNTLQDLCRKYDLKLENVEKFIGTIPDANVLEMAKFLDTVKIHPEDEYEGFMIAAPASEFVNVPPVNFLRWLIDDPIVSKPVHDGFLFVTAWGDEASDPDVLNERNN